MPGAMFDTCLVLPVVSQAGKGPGGEPDGGCGEAEPGAEDEGRDHRGQNGGSKAQRAARGRRM